jgi:hypothetical protein
VPADNAISAAAPEPSIDQDTDLDWDASLGGNSIPQTSDDEPYPATMSQNNWDSGFDDLFNRNPHKRRRRRDTGSTDMSSPANTFKARALTSPPRIPPPQKKMIVPADPSSAGPSRGALLDGEAQSAWMTLQSRIAVPANAPKPRGARVLRGRRGSARPPVK